MTILAKKFVGNPDIAPEGRSSQVIGRIISRKLPTSVNKKLLRNKLYRKFPKLDFFVLNY